MEALEEQREATLDVLTAYSPTFLEYRTRYDRSAGLDANLTAKWQAVNDHMDYLLERYFSLIGGVELETIPDSLPLPKFPSQIESVEITAAQKRKIVNYGHEPED